MGVDPITLEQSIVFLAIVLAVATAYDVLLLRRSRANQVEDVAEQCPQCDRLTYGLNGPLKWCCYCGARMPGLYVRIIPPKVIPGQVPHDTREYEE